VIEQGFPKIFGKIVINNASQGGPHVPLELDKMIIGVPQKKSEELIVTYSYLYSHLFAVSSVDSH